MLGLKGATPPWYMLGLKGATPPCYAPLNIIDVYIYNIVARHVVERY